MGLLGDLFGEGVEEFSEEMDGELDDYLEQLYEELVGVNDEFCDPGNAPNEGSAVAMEQDIGPMGTDIVESWQDGWPWTANAYEWEDAVLSAHECAVDCFIASANDASKQMGEIIKEARMASVIEAIL